MTTATHRGTASLARRHTLALLAGTVAARSARAQAGDTVTVFAAASLMTALDAIGAAFEAATGHGVRVSLGGSASIARQIDHGAPADVVIAASRDWIDWLETRGRLVPGSRRDLLGNRLVLIAHDPAAAPVTLDQALDLGAMLGAGRLAMALVDAVPAGLYGRAALQHLGLWAAVADRVAQTDNVRAALALVATGAAPLGIVYATDAAADPRVRVLGTFPADSHPPIVYPAALIAGRERPAAAAFLGFLEGAVARQAFAAQGFLPLTAP